MTVPQCYAVNHYAGGQPTPDDLADLSRRGVRTVINLRGADEPIGFDEASEAARLGMRYEVLPISGSTDLDLERVQRFGALLDEARREGGVLIHCASSNRVGALVALDEALNRGTSLDQVLDHGGSAGLKALEPAAVTLAESEDVRQ